MSSLDAGAVIVSLQNSSRGRGQSAADDARRRTEASDLSVELSLLAGKQGGVHPMRCHVGIVLRQLSVEDRESLVRLIDEPRPDGTMVPATEIAGVLARAGLYANAPSIRRHRRRSMSNTDRCNCE
jgi:hypothetical protein